MTKDMEKYEGKYAVIFSSTLINNDSEYDQQRLDEYHSVAEEMVELASKQPGFIDVESSRGGNGFGISVSYWQDLESIQNWKDNELHALARKNGKEKWYQSFSLRIAKIERAYSFET